MKKIAGLVVVLFVASVAFAGCAAKGEKLWEKACNHMADTVKAEAAKEGAKKELSKEELEKGLKDCMEGFKKLDPAVADEAANCVVGKSDMKGFGECMAKAAEKKAKEGAKKEAEKK